MKGVAELWIYSVFADDFDGQLKKDFYAIYKSEVLGETLFGVCAALSKGESQEKWEYLRRLETQTKERFLDFSRELDVQHAYPVFSKLTGYMLGVLFALLPWQRAMKLIGSGTPALIEVFSRLQERGPKEGEIFFDYVLAHELAIQQFARDEIQGKPDAYKHINALLEEQGSKV